jgi:hypothetical protein
LEQHKEISPADGCSGRDAVVLLATLTSSSLTTPHDDSFFDRELYGDADRKTPAAKRAPQHVFFAGDILYLLFLLKSCCLALNIIPAP